MIPPPCAARRRVFSLASGDRRGRAVPVAGGFTGKELSGITSAASAHGATRSSSKLLEEMLGALG